MLKLIICDRAGCTGLITWQGDRGSVSRWRGRRIWLIRDRGRYRLERWLKKFSRARFGVNDFVGGFYIRIIKSEKVLKTVWVELSESMADELSYGEFIIFQSCGLSYVFVFLIFHYNCHFEHLEVFNNWGGKHFKTPSNEMRGTLACLLTSVCIAHVL